MKNISNIALFSLQIVHEYYDNGNCSLFEYKPTIETQQLLDKYPLELRKFSGGFELYSQSKTASFLEYIQSISGLEGFVFHIAVQSNTVYDQTEIPKDQLGEYVFDSAKVASNISGINILQPNFKNKNSTVYFGKVTIRFFDLIKQNAKQWYEIQLKTRSTFWKYYIVNNGQLRYKSFKIESVKKEVEFFNAQQVTLKNGQAATLIATNTKLKLSEYSKYNFNLLGGYKRLGKESQKVVYEGLPNADCNHYDIETQENEQQFVSPMYIYV